MSCELDIDDVAAQSPKAKRELKELRDLLTATADALDYLTGMTQQQAAALRKDAKRYRWLRELPNSDSLNIRFMGSDLDTVIDSALASVK